MGGLRKALKRITGGLRKAIKSPVGKLLLAGAAMWAGGQIIGRMGQTAAGSAAGGSAGAETTAASQALAPTETAAAAAPVTPPVSTPTPPPSAGGILSRSIKGIGGFIEKHPMASAMAFNAASSALSPDETELMEEQEKIRRQRYQDMAVPNSIGLSPRGIINQGMKA